VRNPRRWRNIALAFLAAGVVACVAALLVPANVAGDTVRALAFAFGITAVIFGAGVAIVRHLDARAQDALGRGEDVLARWHVDADTWQAFVTYDRQLSQDDTFLPNELLPRDAVPAAGLAVIVGETAVQVGESIHRLPRRGTPEVTHADLNKGRVRPSFIDLRLYYPGGGGGASGSFAASASPRSWGP
jgi:hypothetical protein